MLIEKEHSIAADYSRRLHPTCQSSNEIRVKTSSCQGAAGRSAFACTPPSCDQEQQQAPIL